MKNKVAYFNNKCLNKYQIIHVDYWDTLVVAKCKTYNHFHIRTFCITRWKLSANEKDICNKALMVVTMQIEVLIEIALIDTNTPGVGV